MDTDVEEGLIIVKRVFKAAVVGSSDMTCGAIGIVPNLEDSFTIPFASHYLVRNAIKEIDNCPTVGRKVGDRASGADARVS